MPATWFRITSAWRRDDSGAGIVVTNLAPYVGTFVMIAAGIASYPVERAAVYALVSTVLNYVLIVWLVLGSVRLVSGS